MPVFERLDSKHARGGFSLPELLLSMLLLTMMVIALAELFAFATEIWSRQVDGLDTQVDLVEATALLRHDLEAAFAGRAASWAPFDDSILTGHPAPVQRFYRDAIRRRMLIPFEVDRTQGKQDLVSLPHAEPCLREGRRLFSTLAFAAVKPGAGCLYPATFDPDRYGALASRGTTEGSPVMPSDLCLIGYYVAYTRDSGLATDSAQSMKLYRHFRPAERSLGAGQAGSVIRAISHSINRVQVPAGKLANKDLDYLLAFSAPEPDQASRRVQVERPWPLWGEYRPPGPMPSREDPNAWLDPDHPLHAFVYADAPLVQNVVRFEVRPYKKVNDGGIWKLMDASQLAAHLRLPGPDWPVLIVPDLLEIAVSVIPPGAAAKLRTKEDWLVFWEGEEIAGPETSATRVIRASVQTVRFQVPLRSSP